MIKQLTATEIAVCLRSTLEEVADELLDAMPMVYEQDQIDYWEIWTEIPAGRDTIQRVEIELLRHIVAPFQLSVYETKPNVWGLSVLALPSEEMLRVCEDPEMDFEDDETDYSEDYSPLAAAIREALEGFLATKNLRFRIDADDEKNPLVYIYPVRCRDDLADIFAAVAEEFPDFYSVAVAPRASLDGEDDDPYQLFSASAEDAWTMCVSHEEF